MIILFRNKKKHKTIFSLAVFILIINFCFGQVTYEDAFPNISFNLAVELQNAADNTNRIFVVEQPGLIKVFPNDVNVTTANVTTFLDLTSEVTFSSGQEIGLLGLAFDPNYSQNRYFYVYYTKQQPVAWVSLDIIVARYTASATNPNTAVPSSRLEIFRFNKNQGTTNHNGGKIAFGPDGYLYCSIGDGGGGGDPNGNGQNLNTVLGSILRIDVNLDGNNPVSSNGNYEIPSDNPRVGLSGLDELYAWGIRNTWKFSFDIPTNRLWAADVGQVKREEINLIVKGGNYGWNRYEGNEDYDTSTILATNPDIKPIFEYDRSATDLSVTGGYVYRGASNNPSLKNKYIFGDYISGRVWSLDYNSTTNTASRELLFKTNGQFVSSFGLDEQGELYFSSYGTSGKIYKIIGGNNGPVTTPVNGIGNWSTLNSGVNGTVSTLALRNNGDIIVGGEFTNANGIAVNNIAIYNPSIGWSAFPSSGSNGKINAIKIDSNGKIYAGGSFTQIGGVNANHIAVWDGSNWQSLSTGTNKEVLKIGIDANNLVYAGGAFETVGGLSANNIAMWNGTIWSTLMDNTTNENGTNNEIRSIAFDENNILYIGGNFSTAGGKSALRIATWNGTNWGTLGTGTSGFVQAIIASNNYIYAGGNFSIAGDQTVNRLARWNRTTNSWEKLGFGVTGNVNDLQHDGNYLYTIGAFESASDTENIFKIMNGVARWSDSNGWEALGTNYNVGINNTGNSLLFSADKKLLYAGGNFAIAGAVNALNIAKWGLIDCATTPITPEYQINGGNWNNGISEIQISEGANLLLSTVESDTGFTITLPNSNQVTNNYTINSITTSSQGNYIFTNSNGCTASLLITVLVDNDDDNDGILNNEDTCPNTPTGETVNTSGCSQSQLDDDNDGVNNAIDQCPNTPIGEAVNSSGCSQSQLDDDNDGLNNTIDQCPNTPIGEAVNSSGCSQNQLDDDNDGVNNAIDQCPNTPNNTTVNSNGCSGSQLDDDSDGVTNNLDQCPNTPTGATVDSYGCQANESDGDNDGVLNINDSCPNTPVGATVDANGCSPSQLDDDNDGVSNNLDQCANTPSGASVNSNGCAQSQLDSDNDGVKNNNDLCPNTPSGQSVNANGCAQSQLDNDNDGVPNDSDQCPNTPSGSNVDTHGCTIISIPNTNFQIASTSVNCNGGNTGTISIVAASSYNYTAILTGNSISNSFSFTDNLNINTLSAGTYELCLTVAESPNYENCSTIIISEPELLAVQIELNGSDNSIDIFLSGSENYMISINEISFTTQEKKVTIPLVNNRTNIKVNTDLPCQGVYEETIVFPNNSFVYPNPFENEITIFLGDDYNQNAEISLFTNTGDLVDTQNTTIQNGQITYYTEVLSSGLYYLSIAIGEENMVFKVLKK